MNYADLIQAIQAQIRDNTTQAITGQILQDILVEMVQELGQAGAVFGGVVDRDFTPAATDSNIFYVASVPGTYSGFGQSVSVGEFAIFYFDGSDWQKATVTSAEVEVTPGSENGITLATISVGGQNYLIKAEVKDSTPIPNSTHPVESGGVSAAITAVASSTAAALALKADKTYVDNQLALKADATTVAGKVDKVPAAEAGNVAMFDATGGIEDSEVPADNLAQQDGYYSTLIAGAAENLVGQDVQTAQFTRRVSGGTADVGTGAALIKSIKGNTLVWDQLYDYDTEYQNLVSVPAAYQATLSVDTTKKRVILTSTSTVTGTTGNSSLIRDNNNNVTAINGHIYYIALNIKTFSTAVQVIWGDSVWTRYTTTPGVFTRVSFIRTGAGGTGLPRIYYAANGGTWNSGDTVELDYFEVFDLTQMFGAGNEPSTAAEFEAMFPLNYYANVTPFLLNNKAASLVTTGFNQLMVSGRTEDTSAFTHLGVHTFSEDKYIKGYAATDYKNVNQITSFQITDNSVTVLTANSAYGIGLPMRCWPSTQYYIQVTKSGSGSSINTIGFYDIDGVWISKSEVLTNPITTPANCYWMVFNVVPVANNASVTYSNICINKSDTDKNGTYEPYEKHTLQLNLTGLTSGGTAIFADGMKSAGSVYDEVDGAKAVKRIGVVDLGTLSYTKYDTADGTLFRFTVTGAVYQPSANLPVNLRCANYITTSQSARGEKTISSGVSSFDIIDSTYSDATTFRTAMSGVYLYYELATPEEYTLDAPLSMQYEINNDGTETILPENGSTPTTAPFLADIQYAMNAVDTLRNLPKNYISKASMDSILTAFKTAGVITAYTLTWDSTNNKYNCTITV